MNILADASLPGLKQAFPEPFHLTLYHHADEIIHLLSRQDVLLCRSTLKVNQSLLKNNYVRYVATASSGTDHLDHHWLASQNIQIIDAKGSNARSVADYVMSSLAYLEQHQLIQGKRAGIIGMGKVGTQVAARLHAADFQILAYDPLKALHEPREFQSCLLEELFQSDLLCIHAELHNEQPYPSMNLIDQHFLAQLKPGCVILNAARGGIVNEEALLHTQQPLTYCTDVFLNEPTVDKRIIDKATLCTPHIAGHSLEAKYVAVAMISATLHQLAGLPNPQFATPQIKRTLSVQDSACWQNVALALYNPFIETQQLKAAINKKSAFLTVRKNHQNRHDFLLHINPSWNHQTRLILGA